MIIARALRDGVGRVHAAPSVVFGVYLLTLLLALPFASAMRSAIGDDLGHSLTAARVADAVGCGVPVILAGGAIANDRKQLLAEVGTAIQHGAAGVAFGRNVWGTADPAGMVRSLCEVVHGTAGRA